RDFDEPFFFAGTSDAEIARFKAVAAEQKLSLREHGVLWSLSVGADVRRCIREVGELYDRALRTHASRFAVVPFTESKAILPACDRGVVFSTSRSQAEQETPSHSGFKVLSVTAANFWNEVLGSIASH